jgi:hypothetical protein
VKWAKACRDSGVDERRVQVAEQQGRQLATVLTTSFDALLVALTEQFPREKLEAVWRAVLPGIVRGAIEAVNVAGDA